MKDLYAIILLFLHPSDGCRLLIAQHKKHNYLVTMLMLLTVVLTKVLYVYFVSFQLQTVSRRDANPIIEIGMVLVPLITWAVASYAASSIMGGETTMGQCFVASVYCMIPYVIITLVLLVVSQFAGHGDMGLFTTLKSLALIWVCLLEFWALKELNGYTVGQALKVSFVSVVFMAIFLIVVVLLYAFIGQLFVFGKDLALEYRVFISR